MNDLPDAHLSDEVLNEYLDGALEAATWHDASAHLGGCPACAARLAELQALFAHLDSLPSVALTRDLAPGVLQAVRQATARGRLPANIPRRPVFRLLFGLQLLAGLALLWFAWPFVASRWPGQWSWTAAGEPAAMLLGDLLARTRELIAIRTEPASLAPLLMGWLEAARGAVQRHVVPNLAPVELGLAVAISAALWVVGNALLLRPGRLSRSGRRL
jgi:anti-sigma factor RsiW